MCLIQTDPKTENIIPNPYIEMIRGAYLGKHFRSVRKNRNRILELETGFKLNVWL